jgi:DNA invertase Pin-like site-specific DNA recombinase
LAYDGLVAPRAAIVYTRPAGVGAPDEELAVAVDDRFDVVAVVHDDSGEERAKLAGALHGVASGRASAIVTPKLRSVAGSLRDLVALLDWLDSVGAELVALDVGLDTGSASGRRFAAMLREIAGWASESRPGHRGRGRPGLAHEAPELVDRIAALRDLGLSLQAIADALNAEGVPTPRGGAEWRPSSVQAALGYRRPRPPAPGLPPPPPPPPGPRGRHQHPRPGPPGPPAPPHRPRPRP